MAIFEGEMEAPELWFLSGDRAHLLRTVPTSRRGVPFLSTWMIPSEKMRFRYNIDEDKLNYQISSDGAYVFEYPASFFVDLSLSNPEYPVKLLTCDFYGNGIETTELGVLATKISRLENLNASLRAENQKLMEALKHSMQKVRGLEGIR